jgi:hypothetical protein
VISKDGNPDMSVAAVFSIVIERTQSEVAFQQPEGILDSGQGNINVPDGVISHVGAVTAQMIASVQFGVGFIFLIIPPP